VSALLSVACSLRQRSVAFSVLALIVTRRAILSHQPSCVRTGSRHDGTREPRTNRPRLVDAEGRTVRFADHRLLEDVGVVVWATGYRSDYAWIHIPGVVREGHVDHRRGVTGVPGLYFLGLSWQHTRGSALLGFVNDDATFLADRIQADHQAAMSGTVPATKEPSR
jgi:hypothetical protein